MGAQQSHKGQMYNFQYGYHSVSSVGILKWYELTSKDEQQSFKNLLERYNSFNVPTILPILLSQPYSDPHNAQFQWKLIFKKLNNTLEDEVITMRKSEKFYSQSDILKIIDCVLSGLMAFRLKELIHGNINCENIFIDYNQQNQPYDVQHNEIDKVYVIGLPLLLNANFERNIIQQKSYHRLYLSPLNLLEINEGREKLTVCQKSQIFSLGIVILKLATLKDVSQIYDYSSFSIVQQTLKQRIEECQSRYSKQFVEMVKKMLKLEQHLRPDFQQLYKIFSNIPVQQNEAGIIIKTRPDSPPREEHRTGQTQNSEAKIIYLNNSGRKKLTSEQRRNRKIQNSTEKKVKDEVSYSSIVQNFKISNKSKRAWIKLQTRRQNATGHLNNFYISQF